MKRILRSFLIETVSLYALTQISEGLIFEDGIQTLLLAAAALTVTAFLAKPIINMLLLPINLVTFGLFKWVSSAIALYLVTLIVPGFKIASFYFPGYISETFSLPAFSFSGFFAYIAFSFSLSIFTSLLHWIIK